MHRCLTCLPFVVLLSTACRRETGARPGVARAEATPVTVAAVTNFIWDQTVPIVDRKSTRLNSSH